MGPGQKSGREKNQTSSSKQESGVILLRLSILVPKSSRARALNADWSWAEASQLLLAYLQVSRQ